MAKNTHSSSRAECLECIHAQNGGQIPSQDTALGWCQLADGAVYSDKIWVIYP